MIIDRLEWLFVRLQDFTGVPRWRYAMATTQAWGVCVVLRAITEMNPLTPSWRYFGVIIGVSAFFASFLSSFVNKAEQRQADRTMMVVPNELRDTRFSQLVRAVAILDFVCMVMLATVPPRPTLIHVLDNSTFVAMCYVNSFHTFPMTGTSLKTRVRNLIARLRPTAAQEVV